METVACAVLASRQRESLAHEIFGQLQKHLPRQIKTIWQPAPAEQADCNLFVLAAGAAEHESILAEMQRLRCQRPTCGIIVVCVDSSSEQIGSLLAGGAFDFVSTPCSGRELGARVQRAAGLLPAPRPDLSAAPEAARAHGLVGTSPAFMKQLLRLPMIAGCDAGVLILGETGTGKEVFARAVHYLSSRGSRPWVAVNCGAIPTELMESELFGHVRGAFTSAHAARTGLVREAEGGTLFLDEIDS